MSMLSYKDPLIQSAKYFGSLKITEDHVAKVWIEVEDLSSTFQAGNTVRGRVHLSIFGPLDKTGMLTMQLVGMEES